MAADRTMKFLLSAIALLLLALLVRPALTVPAAEAQTTSPKTNLASQMIEDHGTVYVLQNGVLGVYQLEEPETGLKNHPLVRLRRLTVQNVTNP